MNGFVDWYAAITGIIAAAMVAWDHSRKITGWGFILFCTTSVAWVITGIINGTVPLAIQNVIMLVINAIGVYRYLIRKKKPA